MTRTEFFEFFKQNNIVDNYSKLCQKFNSLDNRKHPMKEDVLELLKKWDIELKYSSREKLFYKEIKNNEIKFQFNLYTKDGMISTSYMVWNTGVKTPVYRGGVRFICEELNLSSIEKLEYPYPFSSSNEDLIEIFNFYLNLYTKFIERFLLKSS
jgi:hypothetical protein